MEAAYADRIQDLLDAYELGDIDRRTFINRMQELNFDYHEAATQANMIDEQRSDA